MIGRRGHNQYLFPDLLLSGLRKQSCWARNTDSGAIQRNEHDYRNRRRRFHRINLVAALSDRDDLARDIVVCDTLGSGEKWRNIAKRELADIILPEDLRLSDAHKARLKSCSISVPFLDHGTR